MCGIFGFSLKKGTTPDVARVAMQKFKILGIFNKTRGKDSCGVSINDTLYKGVLTVKEFPDFIQKNVLPNPTEVPMVLGHTRASTKGSHTEENAHPFLVQDKLIGTHNGVIQNIDDLCRKYDLKPTDYKVDSLALYHLILNEGMSILNEYVGYAALAFRYLDDPEAMWLYHGASKNTKGGKVYEERPLFFMRTEEGLYYSSLEESLNAIRESEDQEPECLNYNNVFEVKNGEFTGKYFSVDREENNITTVGNANKAASPSPTSNSHSNLTKTSGTGTGATSTSAAGTEKNYEPVILKETLPAKATENGAKDIIYWHQGRYWEFRRKLAHGPIVIVGRGQIVQPGSAIPKEAETYYFYQGVMLKGKEEYDIVSGYEVAPHSFVNQQATLNFAACISKYAAHPVCNMPHQAERLTPFFRHGWYNNDKRANGSFTPKFSGRHYVMESGFLKEIKSSQREQTMFSEYAAAKMEAEVFAKGGILSSDAPGGASCNAPFRADGLPSGDCCSIEDRGLSGFSRQLLDRNTKRVLLGSEDNPNFKGHQNESPEDNSIKYFYEISFRSFEEAMENIGELEAKALRRYAKLYLEHDSPLDADDREIEMCVCDLIKMAVDNQCSLLDMTESREDEQRMINAYQHVLDDQREIQYMKDAVLPFEPDEYTPENYAVEVTQTFEDESSDMDIKDIMNEQTETLANMLNDAANLAADSDSDLAQEAAAAMYKGIATIQGNLASIAEKHGLKDLSSKFKSLNKRED